MNICCSICKRDDVFKIRYDDYYYCAECSKKYICLKCNRQYNACHQCSKRLCNYINYKVEYDYGDEYLCIECFEKQDPLTNLYKYFKKKYNETMTLEQIQKIMYNN